MTLREIVNMVEVAYDKYLDVRLTDYVDLDGFLVEPPPAGDRLAEYLVRELSKMHNSSDPSIDGMWSSPRKVDTELRRA
jgi:hypothetical protein